MGSWSGVPGVLLLAGMVSTGTAKAADAEGRPFYRIGILQVAGDDRDFVQLGASAFDVLDNDRSTALNVEYRFGKKAAFIGPTLGILANTDGGVYGYGGFYVDLAVGPVHITPVLSAGYYAEGDSKDLGSAFEFRQSLDLSYRFEGGVRLGMRIAHISNAHIGDHNPGQEDAQIILAIPFGPVFD